MTKVIYILRHGEAEYGSASGEDFQRKLTPQGRNDVKRVARILKENHEPAELLIHSPALRTTETAEEILEIFTVPEIKTEGNIYEASPQELLDLVTGLPDQYSKVMLVGHNPGLGQLINYLSDHPLLGLSPGMCVKLELFSENWIQLTKGIGSIREVIQ
jgi:phosphohistidine phosphatase